MTAGIIGRRSATREAAATAVVSSERVALGTRRIALLTLGYGLVAAVVTWPLVLHLGTGIPGNPRADQGQYLWCVDTFWTQVLQGKTPFVTDRVLYPVGANLMHTGLAPFVSLFALPFGREIVLYLAVAVLASFVLAALGMAALVRRLTGNAAAGAVAGLFYGLGPAVLSFADASHYYKVASAALLPWGLYALVGFLRDARPRSLVGVSAVAWALVFTDYYMAVLFILLVAIVGVFGLQRRHVPLVAVAAVANVLLGLAVVRWLLPPLDTGDLLAGGGYFWSHANANLADFLVPSSHNPLLGRFGAWATDRPNGDVDCYFLGWGILALELVAVARFRRVPLTGAFALAGVTAAILACGTALRFGSHTLVTEAWLPWYWLVRLPYMNALDLPRCFVLGTLLAAATLAGAGLAFLAERLGSRTVALLGVALFAIEYGQVGMRLYIPEVPSLYRRLATMPEGTLLELPSGVTESKRFFGYDLSFPNNNEQMYFQTVHRKRRVGAYLSRIPLSTYQWFDREPVIGDIFTLTTREGPQTGGVWRTRYLERLPDYPPETVSRFIRTFDLRYVLAIPNYRQELFLEGMERLLAGRIAERLTDDGYVLFVIDRSIE